jgi:hypothetical protein
MLTGNSRSPKLGDGASMMLSSARSCMARRDAAMRAETQAG